MEPSIISSSSQASKGKYLAMASLRLLIAWYVISLLVVLLGTPLLVGAHEEVAGATYRYRITSIVCYSAYWLFVFVKNKAYRSFASAVCYLLSLGLAIGFTCLLE